jgi:RNA recognition motif-containing protein
VSRHRSPLFGTQPQPRLCAASSRAASSHPRADRVRSLSTQIIYRGQRSAGYGFVAFNTLEAAQNAAELLNKKELDGRVVIVEIAKPAEEKQYEKSEKKPIKRRVSKKVRAAAAAATDAVTPAKDEAGDASAAEKTEGETKPKKKRNIVSFSSRDFVTSYV